MKKLILLPILLLVATQPLCAIEGASANLEDAQPKEEASDTGLSSNNNVEIGGDENVPESTFSKIWLSGKGLMSNAFRYSPAVLLAWMAARAFQEYPLIVSCEALCLYSPDVCSALIGAEAFRRDPIFTSCVILGSIVVQGVRDSCSGGKDGQKHYKS